MELEHILKSRGEIKLTFDASGQLLPLSSPYTPHNQHQQQPSNLHYGYGYRPMPPPSPPPVTRGFADILHLPRLQNTFIFHSWQVNTEFIAISII